MDPITETQFHVTTPGPLLAAIRAALASAERPPSRDEITGWVAEGRVRVEENVVWDPRRVVDAGQRVGLAAWPRNALSFGEHEPDDVIALQYLDPDLVVAEYTPQSARGDYPTDLVAPFRRLLRDAGVHDMDPVPIPGHEMRASGLVSARLTPEGVALVDDSPWPLGARVTVRAIVEAPPDANLDNLMFSDRNPEATLVRTPPAPSSVDVFADLEARGLRVLEDGSVEGAPGQRPILLHVAGLALTHPRTCRTHQWACRQPASFKAALETARA